jgi:hypothetical protein
MGFDGFTMPPALAGDDNEITPDGEGAKNFLKVTGGLTAILLALVGAAFGKNRILNLLGADESSQVSMTVS